MNTSLYKLFEELHEHHLHFIVQSQEPDSIIVRVNVPGERWKIRYLASGVVKVEIFKNTEGVLGEEKLAELLKILDIDSDDILQIQSGMDKLFTMINRLHRGKKIFSMAMHREMDFPVMVELETDGQYWEIEFFESGEVEVEALESDGKIYNEDILQGLIQEFSDEQ